MLSCAHVKFESNLKEHFDGAITSLQYFYSNGRQLNYEQYKKKDHPMFARIQHDYRLSRICFYLFGNKSLL